MFFVTDLRTSKGINHNAHKDSVCFQLLDIYRVYQKKRYDFEMLRMSCFLQSRQMTPSGIKIMFNYRLYHVKRFIV